MAIDAKIIDEKLQYDTNREAAKVSYILPYDQRRMIEQAKFTYSPIVKTLEKQTKTTEDQGNKHIKAIEDHENNWLNLMNLLKSIFTSTEIVYLHKQ